MIIATVATLTNSSAFAQTTKSTGAAAQAGTYSSDSFAWGIGLGALAVVATVVGVTVASAVSTNSSH